MDKILETAYVEYYCEDCPCNNNAEWNVHNCPFHKAGICKTEEE